MPTKPAAKLKAVSTAKTKSARADNPLKERPWPGPKLTYTELGDLCEVITDGDAGDLNDSCAPGGVTSYSINLLGVRKWF